MRMSGILAPVALTLALAGCGADAPLVIDGEAREITLRPGASADIEIASATPAFVRWSLEGPDRMSRSAACPTREMFGLGQQPACGTIETVDAPVGKATSMWSKTGGAITAHPVDGRAVVRLTSSAHEQMTWSVRALPPI